VAAILDYNWQLWRTITSCRKTLTRYFIKIYDMKRLGEISRSIASLVLKLHNSCCRSNNWMCVEDWIFKFGHISTKGCITEQRLAKWKLLMMEITKLNRYPCHLGTEWCHIMLQRAHYNPLRCIYPSGLQYNTINYMCNHIHQLCHIWWNTCTIL